MYRLVDRIIVHTPKMKEELCSLFRISTDKVFVIPHGINKRIARKGMTQKDARCRLGVGSSAHIVLFFGQIDEYKGVETLIDAAASSVKEDPSILLIVAGKPKRRSDYVPRLQEQAAKKIPRNNVLLRFQFIPLDEVETYFAAADCIVLPYKRIYQSGVIFLAYRFGLPIIATDVGSLRDEVIEGVTGFVCGPDDAEEMSAAIKRFFNSSLFRRLEQTRADIIELAEKKYSWTDIAGQTHDVYKNAVKDQ